MSLYLPIAEMSLSVWVLLATGAAVGFLSGLFGVGGGFIMTPLLTLLGLPPAVAVATGIVPIISSSVGGSLARYRRNQVDVTMGAVLITGGVVGSGIGVATVAILRRVGQFDLAVALAYVTFLGAVGVLMLVEGLPKLPRRSAQPSLLRGRRSEHVWLHGLPFKQRFRRSKLYISTLPILVIGAFNGFLAAVMGLGGSIVMVPALIYILRVPASVAVGTSLFQAVFVTALTAILQALLNQTVDLPLALMLVVGTVCGTELGATAAVELQGRQPRLLLAAVVLMVAVRVGYDLVVPPAEPYSLQTEMRGLR